MLRPLFICLCFVFLPALSLSAIDLNNYCLNGRVKGRFIVTWSKASSSAEIEDALLELNLNKVRELRTVSDAGDRYLILETQPGTNDQTKYQELLNRTEVVEVYPDCFLKKADAGALVRGTVLNRLQKEISEAQVLYPAVDENILGRGNLDNTSSKINLHPPLNPAFDFSQYSMDTLAINRVSEHTTFTTANRLDVRDNSALAIMCSLSYIAPNSVDTNFELVANLGDGQDDCAFTDGDIDNDGYRDIIVAEKTTPLGENTDVAIVWGGGVAQDITNGLFDGTVRQIKVARLIDDNSTELIALTVDGYGGVPSSAKIEYSSFINGDFTATHSINLPTIVSHNAISSLDVGDYNNDGLIDIVAVGGQAIWFITNHGNQNFHVTGYHLYNLAGHFADENRDRIYLKDLNNNGFPDLIGTSTGGIVIFKNLGGSFGLGRFLNIRNSYATIGLGDVQSDGLIDIVLMSPYSDRGIFLLNQGEADVTPPLSYFTGSMFRQSSQIGFRTSSAYSNLGIPAMLRRDAYVGMKVKLSEIEGQEREFIGITDKMGDVRFRNVPNGIYAVSLDKPYELFISPEKQTVKVQGKDVSFEVYIREDYLRDGFIPPEVQPVRRSIDPGFDGLWGLHNGGGAQGKIDIDLDIDEAWGSTMGSAEVVVALLDDGFDYQHPELSGQVYVNSKEIADNGIDDDDNGYVDDYYGYNFADNLSDPKPLTKEQFHGTHVGGTIAAKADNGLGIAGVAPGIKVLPLKIMSGEENLGSVSVSLMAYDYLLGQIEAGMPVKVLNASFVSNADCIAPEKKLLFDLSAAGVSLVFAAGNEKKDLDDKPGAPAVCEAEGLLSVAAVNSEGELARFSNYGLNSVDLAAPGVNIWSTTPFAWADRSRSAYQTLSGTSMAAAYVSGVLALMSSLNSDLSPAERKQIALTSVKKITALEEKMLSPGILSAKLALLKVMEDLTGDDPGEGDAGKDDGPDFDTTTAVGQARLIIYTLLLSITDLRANISNLSKKDLRLKKREYIKSLKQLRRLLKKNKKEFKKELPRLKKKSIKQAIRLTKRALGKVKDARRLKLLAKLERKITRFSS